MPLAEGQLQLRSLVFGAETSHQLATRFNPFDLAVRSGDQGPRPFRDGSWSGAEFQSEKVVPMRFITMGVGTTQFVTLHQLLAAAFAPSHEDLALTFVLGGAEYVLFGRPRTLAQESRGVDGHSYYRAAFVALDPIIYSSTEHSQVLVLPTSSGGLTIPVEAPFSIGATVLGNHATITNAGTATVGLRLRIDGPAVEPRFSLLPATGGVTTLRFALTLTSGQWLDVDTSRRTVYLNGTVSRRGNAYSSDPSGAWPLLPPGTSDISFDAATYAAEALLTVFWRDGWR